MHPKNSVFVPLKNLFKKIPKQNTGNMCTGPFLNFVF